MSGAGRSASDRAGAEVIEIGMGGKLIFHRSRALPEAGEVKIKKK